jgi:hypothetical protein
MGLFVPLMPFKVALFFAILTRFHFRARTAWMAGLSLGSTASLVDRHCNGGRQGMDAGGLASAEAIALALSFVVAAPLYRKVELVYDKPFLAASVRNAWLSSRLLACASCR